MSEFFIENNGLERAGFKILPTDHIPIPIAILNVK